MTSIYRTTHAVQIRTGRVTLTLDIPQAHELLAQLARALDETNILPSVAILWEDFAEQVEQVEPDETLDAAWTDPAVWHMPINPDDWKLARPTSTAAPLDGGHIEPLIGAAEAQTIAQDVYGLRIPKSTLISAYPTIDGAQKVGGRWKMPPGNFREWLDTWASKQ